MKVRHRGGKIVLLNTQILYLDTDITLEPCGLYHTVLVQYLFHTLWLFLPLCKMPLLLNSFWGKKGVSHTRVITAGQKHAQKRLIFCKSFFFCLNLQSTAAPMIQLLG